MATGFIADQVSQAPDDEPDEIRYKAKLPNECATYLGKTIDIKLQQYMDGVKFGDEMSDKLEMDLDIITTINAGKINEYNSSWFLTRVGCD